MYYVLVTSLVLRAQWGKKTSEVLALMKLLPPIHEECEAEKVKQFFQINIYCK